MIRGKIKFTMVPLRKVGLLWFVVFGCKLMIKQGGGQIRSVLGEKLTPMKSFYKDNDFISQSSKGSGKVMFTIHIRRNREGNVFSCVCPLGGGGSISHDALLLSRGPHRPHWTEPQPDPALPPVQTSSYSSPQWIMGKGQQVLHGIGTPLKCVVRNVSHCIFLFLANL